VRDTRSAAKTSLTTWQGLVGNNQWKTWAPKAVSAALLLALLADSASIALHLAALDRDYLRPTLVRIGSGLPSRTTTDFSRVARAHLFGVVPATATESAQAPKDPVVFKLTGTVASEHDAHQGYAILGTTDGGTRLISPGAAVAGGWHLTLVLADQVVLERLGVQMRVALPYTKSGLTGRQQSRVVAGAAVEDDDSPAPVEDPRRRFWRAELRAFPITQGTVVKGYRLAPRKGLAQRLGLRPGDIVTSLNGVALDSDDAVDKQLQSLGNTVSINILRKGVAQTVRFSLDDTDTGDGSAP